MDVQFAQGDHATHRTIGPVRLLANPRAGKVIVRIEACGTWFQAKCEDLTPA